MIVRVTVRPLRCYIAGRRVHHGLLAIVWLLTDLRDARRWLSDLRHVD